MGTWQGWGHSRALPVREEGLAGGDGLRLGSGCKWLGCSWGKLVCAGNKALGCHQVLLRTRGRDEQPRGSGRSKPSVLQPAEEWSLSSWWLWGSAAAGPGCGSRGDGCDAGEAPGLHRGVTSGQGHILGSHLSSGRKGSTGNPYPHRTSEVLAMLGWCSNSSECKCDVTYCISNI